MSETRESLARLLAERTRRGALEGELEGAGGRVRRGARSRRSRRRSADSASSDPEKVRDVLERVLRRRGLDKQLQYQKLVEDWPRVVGPGLARVTRARSVRNGILVVEVPSSAWAMELNLRRRQIMKRVNDGRSIGIRRVMFVLSQDDGGRKGW